MEGETSAKGAGTQTISGKFLWIVLFASILAVIILPVYTVLFVFPSFTGLLTTDSQDDAVRVANHVKSAVLRDVDIAQGFLPDSFPREIEAVKRDFGLLKIKIFSAEGKIIYSTDPIDSGRINKEKYFHEIVAKGNNFTKVVRKNTKSLEGQTLAADVVETYVPIMKDSAFTGAFEIYMDITERKLQNDKLISQSRAILFIIAFALLTAVVISSLKAGKDLAARKQAEEQIIKQSTELETINAELSALYEVSSALSRTIDMDKLLDAVMNTVTQLEVFHVEKKGGIFIIEEGRMNLISHLGHPEAFLEAHKNMRVGDCLCGLAAQTGEIMISGDSSEDLRHTIRYPEISPHGHICIPLKATNRTIGVLYLYLSAGFDIDEGKKKMLLAIGNQIGIAIENARLYEETKLLSLHDPLTGLANRRLMDIVVERSFAKVKRYSSPISALMLDIDYFKKFNDTYGHIAGDGLLVDIAKILLGEVRDVDLVVRYGGEEFLVLLAETDLQKAQEVAERIRSTIEKEKGITVSLGVSAYQQRMSREDLIHKADEALYQAKQKGRNRVEISI